MRFYQNVGSHIFALRIKNKPLGSPEWHKMQDRVSNSSSVGLDHLKRNLFYSSTMNNCGKNLFVYPGVIFCFPQNIELGNNVYINRGTFVSAPAKIKIGNNVLIGPNVMLNSGGHCFSSADTVILDQGYKSEEIVIENDVWIGGHANILAGVSIGRKAVIGANAVVTKSVPPYAVVAGVPAREIGKRCHQ